MNYKNHLSLLVVCILLLIVGCGPSEEEQQREQARQDSMEQARQDSLQKVRQQRQDSLQKARANNTEEQEPARNNSNVTFSQSGSFSIQVASWRSQKKAQQEVNNWKERGYDQAYVVQHGNESTGDVWYRVRIGRVDSRADAEKIMNNLKQEHQQSSWIAGAN